MALKRALGPVQLTFYGVGAIIGAGIYSVIGVAAGMAGEGVWVSFLLASVVAFLTALSYAELASMSGLAGAEYQYLKLAFPDLRWPAFVAGTLIALNAAATCATVALAFAGYLGTFVELSDVLVAISLLTACALLNLAGIRQATWVGIVLVCIEVAGLLLLIGTGLAAGEPADAIKAPQPDQAMGIFAATALAFFVYIGFEDVANLGEEAKEAKRDIPRALITAVVITSVAYFLVVWAALSLLNPEDLAGSDSPLTTAGGSVSPWIGKSLAVAALVATASTALITLVSISRLLYAMARDGDMPRALSRELPVRKTPWVAGLVLLAMACALVPMGGIKATASVSALGILLVFSAVHVAVLVLRRRRPRLQRGFRIRGAIGGLPVTPMLGALGCLALATRFDATTYGVVAATLAACGIVYAFMRRGRPAGK